MPQFRVEVCSTVYEWRAVEVEAECEEAAGECAIARICAAGDPCPQVGYR